MHVCLLANAELQINDELLDSNGNILVLEDTKTESPVTPTTVYNFQVEDFYTYHVSELGVLVHNAGKEYKVPKSGSGKEKAKDIPSRF